MGKTKTFYTGHITLEKNSCIPEWKQKKIQKSFPYSWWTLKVKHPSARSRDPFKTAMCPTHPTGKEGTYSKLPCDKGVACWTSKGDQSWPGGSFFLHPGGGAVFNKCLYPPRGPSLYPLYTIFHGFPFRILFIDKCNPPCFHPFSYCCKYKCSGF